MNPFSSEPAPIAVLDLKGGQLVAARRGQRAFYQPLEQSYRLPCRTPRQWALLSAARWGFSTFYIADLDAMSGVASKTGIQLSEELLQAGFDVWLDCGPSVPPEPLISHPGFYQMLPTEGGSPVSAEGQVLLPLPPCCDKAVLSLDLHWLPAGQLGWFGSNHPLDDSEIEPLFEWALANHIQRVLILNLTDVGVPGNSMLAFFQRWQQRFREIQWYLGGGFHNSDDIETVRRLGVCNVLVGSVLWRSWEQDADGSGR